MEYTQEQLDEVLSKARKEATMGLFTEDELNRKVTAEVDRRVESGIQKGLETNKSKWEEDYKRGQNLTAEQLAAEKLKEAEAMLTAKEREINRKANLTDARDMLTSAGIPKSQYDKVVSILVNDDVEVTKTNVQNFIDTFSSIKTEIETQVKADITKIPPPDQKKNLPTTKADFDKMGFSEKVVFKQTNPELYKDFMK